MKVKHIIRLLLITIAMLTATYVSASLVNIKTLQRMLPNGKNQYIHFFGDRHRQNDYYVIVQHESAACLEIIDWINKEVGGDVSILVESLTDCSGRSGVIKTLFQDWVPDSRSFLDMINYYFKLKQLPVKNIEIDPCYFMAYGMDQARIAGIDYEKFPFEIKPLFVESIKNELRIIKEYDDGEFLNAHYKRVIGWYEEALSQLEHSPLIFNARKNPISEQQHALTALSWLRDTNTLHTIYHCTKKHIFVFCGTAHAHWVVAKLNEGLHCKVLDQTGNFLGTTENFYVESQHRRGPINDYFEKLWPRIQQIERKASEMRKRKGLVFGAVLGIGLTALLYYNWSSITNIWQSIFGSPKMQVNAPTLTVGGG